MNDKANIDVAELAWQPADLGKISAAAREAMERIGSQIAEAGGAARAIREQIARHLDEALQPAARMIAEELGRRVAETIGPAVRGLVGSLNNISGAVSEAPDGSAADRAQTMKGFTCQN